MLILNRNLTGRMVPAFSYTEISERREADNGTESSHPFALAELKDVRDKYEPLMTAAGARTLKKAGLTP